MMAKDSICYLMIHNASIEASVFLMCHRAAVVYFHLNSWNSSLQYFTPKFEKNISLQHFQNIWVQWICFHCLFLCAFVKLRKSKQVGMQNNYPPYLHDSKRKDVLLYLLCWKKEQPGKTWSKTLTYLPWKEACMVLGSGLVLRPI